MWSVFTVEKNWALSVDQCRMQLLKFSVYLTDVLSILLRCNGFPKILKAILDQIGSRLPNSGHDPNWCKLRFGKCFGAFSRFNH